MKNSTMQKKIPQGWMLKKLSDVLDYERPDKYIVKNTSYTKNGKTPVLTANKSFILGYTDEEFGIYKDTPAIIFDDFTTDSKYVDFSFKVKSSAIKILKCKDETADLKFVHEKMRLIKFPIANHKRYYISQYQDLKILLPGIKEQQKIAGILGTVDENIEKTQEAINETEKLKRGLMQQIFTQGIGHTKFKKTKIGEIPERWEIACVGDLFKTIIGGGTPSRKEPKYWDGSIPWMTVKDMSNKKYVYDTEECITEIGLNESSANLIPENNLITSTRMGIGRVYINKIPVAINQDLKGLIAKDDFILDYVYWLIVSIAKQLETKGTGSTVKGIRLEDFKSLDIILTRDKNEQQKIAEILSTIDEKILVNKKLKVKLTLLKKGLMQDLLSGEVRISQKYGQKNSRGL